MNNRSPEMWNQITEYVDFKGKSVIDLGCGTGDFLLYALQAGASSATGVDYDKHTARQARDTAKDKAVVVVKDIEAMDDEGQYDIAICFSVLPYLKNPVRVLDWMHDHAAISLVEMQYSGDGPGPGAVVDDLDMIRFLELVWDNPRVIGRTEVKGRGKYRTIWLCRN